MEDFEWFEVFSDRRLVISSARTALRDIEYGTAVMPQDPNDLVAFRVLWESMLDRSYWEEPAPPGT